MPRQTHAPVTPARGIAPSGAARRSRISAADLMNREVVAIHPDATIRELARLLVRHGVTGVPVVADGRAIGMVSSSDLLWLFDSAGTEAPGSALMDTLDRRTVREIMTPDVFGVSASAGLGELGQFFARHAVHRALVLEEGAVVGIVSIADMLALLNPDHD